MKRFNVESFKRKGDEYFDENYKEVACYTNDSWHYKFHLKDSVVVDGYYTSFISKNGDEHFDYYDTLDGVFFDVQEENFLCLWMESEI